jgi:hypothetical protein
VPDCAVVQQDGKITNKVFQASASGDGVFDVLLYLSKFSDFFAFSLITLELELPSSIFLQPLHFIDLFH